MINCLSVNVFANGNQKFAKEDGYDRVVEDYKKRTMNRPLLPDGTEIPLSEFKHMNAEHLLLWRDHFVDSVEDRAYKRPFLLLKKNGETPRLSNIRRMRDVGEDSVDSKVEKVQGKKKGNSSASKLGKRKRGKGKSSKTVVDDDDVSGFSNQFKLLLIFIRKLSLLTSVMGVMARMKTKRLLVPLREIGRRENASLWLLPLPPQKYL